MGLVDSLPAHGLGQFVSPAVGRVRLPQTLNKRMSCGIHRTWIRTVFERLRWSEEQKLQLTQGSFGHRQEFDWFGVRGQSRCLLQSSQDFSVLHEKTPNQRITIKGMH